MNIKLEKTKWCEVIVIVNAQQYILPDVLAELTALFLFLIMILWLLCTAEMFFLSLLPNVIATEHTGPMS